MPDRQAIAGDIVADLLKSEQANEVMNAGKPVFVTNECSCGPDLVRHRHNGYIYPVGDWENLAEHIVSIICDPVMARKMGQCSLDIINSWNYEADIKGLFDALKWCGLNPSKFI
jgi:glycosyltransferase involved in cell wall biosynthesis